MKTLLVLLILTLGSQAFACICESSPLMRDGIVDTRIENFLRLRFGVEARDIIEMKTLDSKEYMTAKLRAILSTFMLFEPREVKSCVFACEVDGLKTVHKVNFLKNGKECSLVVYSNFKQKMMGGYKSTVRNKVAPECK